LIATLKDEANTIISARFLPDGKQIMTVSREGAVEVWEAEITALNRKLVDKIKFVSDKQYLRSAAISPDGKLIATLNMNNEVKVWQVGGNQSERLNVSPLDREVNSVTFSLDGKLIVTGRKDGTASVWKAGTGSPNISRFTRVVTTTENFEKKEHSPVISATISSDGKRILTASEDGTAKVWDIR